MTSVRDHTPANVHDIVEILGPGTDEALVSAILLTGASRHEILEAFEWLEDDDYMGAELSRTLSARAQQVYDILDRERGDEHERE